MTARDTLLAYADEVNWTLLPVYVTLSFLVAWVGILSVMFFDSQGVTPAEMTPYANAVQLLMGLLVVAPFGMPLLRLGLRRWWSA